MIAEPAIRRVIALCDGTWLSRDIRTMSNIHLPAGMVGIDMTSTLAESTSPQRNMRARYFDGVGLNGSFFNYI